LAGQGLPPWGVSRGRGGQFCQQFKHLCAAAARLYAEAFAADPKRADDVEARHRYNAARSAALSAAGQGKDADKLDAKERPRLRRQALDWLRADLDIWGERLSDAKALEKESIRKVLEHFADVFPQPPERRTANLFSSSTQNVRRCRLGMRLLPHEPGSFVLDLLNVWAC
jgi:hypothetical protein